MNTLTLHIPIENDILLSLNQTPEEFSHELKLWAAISMYYFGKISLARAASLANYHRYDFEKQLVRLNIPISLLEENDAEKEFKLLEELSSCS
jgi:predicted HTH domain antitoxin